MFVCFSGQTGTHARTGGQTGAGEEKSLLRVRRARLDFKLKPTTNMREKGRKNKGSECIREAQKLASFFADEKEGGELCGIKEEQISPLLSSPFPSTGRARADPPIKTGAASAREQEGKERGGGCCHLLEGNECGARVEKEG